MLVLHKQDFGLCKEAGVFSFQYWSSACFDGMLVKPLIHMLAISWKQFDSTYDGDCSECCRIGGGGNETNR